MSILKKVGVPAISVAPGTPVIEAISLMKEKEVDTLFVVENDVLLGAFTQRDIAFRVVLDGKDPGTTMVRDVMTSPAVVLPAKATVEDAIRLMAAHRVPQLPIVEDGLIKGMVTLRNIFREQAADLTDEMDSLVAYQSADGAGG